MTNWLIQHIIVEESTSIQWVKDNGYTYICSSYAVLYGFFAAFLSGGQVLKDRI